MTSSAPPEAYRALQPAAAEARPADLRVGDRAPSFSYMDVDGHWRRFEEFGTKRCLLIVFGAQEADLGELNRLRPAFDELGVAPVAVLDRAGRSIAALARRLGLDGTMLPDPMRAIAGLFNSIDPSSGRPSASYFVLDEHRRIRAMRYGPLPSAEMLLLSSARCLGRPLPASVLTGCNE
jgi:peroxiredoxin